MSLLSVLYTPSPCEANRFQRTLNLSYASRLRRRAKICLNGRRRRLPFHACLVSGDGIGSPDLNIELSASNERRMIDFVVERHGELDRGEKLLQVPLDQNCSKFAKFQEYSTMNMVGTKLGMIQPIFSSPTDRITSGWVILFILIGIVFDKIWYSNTRESPGNAVQPVAVPLVPPTLSLFVEKDVHRKESVEWVNMIIEKLWKVYRSAIEDRMIDLFQPVINDLEKPGYVQGVEVKEFSLGNEPLSVRTVDRRTSRCAHDLQYHVGIRYAGGASLLLLLSLKFGMVSVSVPVGLHDFDIDGELWVKLRLLPSEPWIEVVSWAFVSRPTIKFELSPFRLFNMMG